MLCKTCAHPQRRAIDLALLRGNTSYADLSRQYGLSMSSLYRHKKHLNQKILQAREHLKGNLLRDSLFQFNLLLAALQRTLQNAEADANPRLVLQTVRAANSTLNSISKLKAPLDSETVYRLISSPQWPAENNLLPLTPQDLQDIRRCQARDLFAPCPPPDDDDDIIDDDDIVSDDDDDIFDDDDNVAADDDDDIIDDDEDVFDNDDDICDDDADVFDRNAICDDDDDLWAGNYLMDPNAAVTEDHDPKSFHPLPPRREPH